MYIRSGDFDNPISDDLQTNESKSLRKVRANRAGCVFAIQLLSAVRFPFSLMTCIKYCYNRPIDWNHVLEETTQNGVTDIKADSIKD